MIAISYGLWSYIYKLLQNTNILFCFSCIIFIDAKDITHRCMKIPLLHFKLEPSISKTWGWPFNWRFCERLQAWTMVLESFLYWSLHFICSDPEAEGAVALPQALCSTAHAEVFLLSKLPGLARGCHSSPNVNLDLLKPWRRYYTSFPKRLWRWCFHIWNAIISRLIKWYLLLYTISYTLTVTHLLCLIIFR